MVNFGPLAAEIVSLVWGIPGNFNAFRVLAALLHGTLVVGLKFYCKRLLLEKKYEKRKGLSLKHQYVGFSDFAR